MEEKKKGNKGLVILIVILLLACIGMGSYIGYDKFLNKETEDGKTSNNKTTTNNRNKNQNKQEENSTVADLDLNKCLNQTNMNYSNPVEATTNIGLTPSVDVGKRSVTINTDGSKFGPVSTLSAYYSGEYKMYVDGFDKNVANAYVGELGQDPKGTTLFYVMEDGTVEYTKIFKKEIDSSGNQYYTLNTYQQGEDNYRFHVDGTVKDVKKVIKIYNVNRTSTGSGAMTAIGATKDGSFYDLSIINN